MMKGFTMQVTYSGQNPADVRYNDTVTDALGRTFVALSDAEKDQFGDYQVRTVWCGDDRWLTLDSDSVVTVTYNQHDWNNWEDEN
jgi:hypothetical protein